VLLRIAEEVRCLRITRGKCACMQEVWNRYHSVVIHVHNQRFAHIASIYLKRRVIKRYSLVLIRQQLWLAIIHLASQELPAHIQKEGSGLPWHSPNTQPIFSFQKTRFTLSTTVLGQNNLSILSFGLFKGLICVGNFPR
jgi:hypothetical protein